MPQPDIAEQDQVDAIVAAMSLASEPSVAHALASMAFAVTPPSRYRTLSATLNHANPTWLPDRADVVLPALAITPAIFEGVVGRARMAAVGSPDRSVLVTGHALTGADWLADVLAKVTGHSRRMLDATLPGPHSRQALGGYCEEEADELAILDARLSGPFVAAHAMRANPYSVRLLAQSGISTIVLHRAPTAMLLAMDEAALAARAAGHATEDRLPAGYAGLSSADRHMLLVEMFGLFFIQHQVSWRICAHFAPGKVLFLSAEDVSAGPPEALAETLSAFLGLEAEANAALVSVLAQGRPDMAVNSELDAVARTRLDRLAQLYSAEMSGIQPQ